MTSEYVPGEVLTIPEGQTIAAYRAEKVAALHPVARRNR